MNICEVQMNRLDITIFYSSVCYMLCVAAVNNKLTLLICHCVCVCLCVQCAVHRYEYIFVCMRSGKLLKSI